MIIKEKFEELLQANWTKFLDKNSLLRLVLETARDADYPIVETSGPQKQQIKASITKISVIGLGTFEVWVEFCVPAQNGIAIGTHVFRLEISKESKFELQQTFGSILKPAG